MKAQRATSGQKLRNVSKNKLRAEFDALKAYGAKKAKKLRIIETEIGKRVFDDRWYSVAELCDERK